MKKREKEENKRKYFFLGWVLLTEGGEKPEKDMKTNQQSQRKTVQRGRKRQKRTERTFSIGNIIHRNSSTGVLAIWERD